MVRIEAKQTFKADMLGPFCHEHGLSYPELDTGFPHFKFNHEFQEAFIMKR